MVYLDIIPPKDIRQLRAINNPESFFFFVISSGGRNTPKKTVTLFRSTNNAIGLNFLEVNHSILLMVPKAGIEPAWAKSPVDFESTASTCFTTSAY